MPGPKGYTLPFERRMKKVTIAANGCWHWTGTILNGGYGQLSHGGEAWLAHRFFYTEMVGPIPEGLHLDHVCHNNSDCSAGNGCLHRRCVNPEHLEPVTRQVNTSRGRSANSLKTHCPQGHEYSTENTFITSKGHRLCRACGHERSVNRKYQPGYREKDARAHREAWKAKKALCASI